MLRAVKTMKVSSRLLVLALAALVGVICVAAVALSFLRTSLVDSRRDQIVSLLGKAEHLVEYYRGLEASGKLTREQAQEGAELALAQFNADTRSYFWVTSEGINLVHPNPKVVGTKISGNRTTTGLTDTEAYQQGLAVSHFALVDVLVKHPKNGVLAPKLQGVVSVPAWNWLIGTGFFYDDIDASFWGLAERLMVIALVIFAAVGALAWSMARGIVKTLGGEPSVAIHVASQIASGNLAVDIPVAQNDRSSLLHALGEMRERLRALVQSIQVSSESIATGASEIS